MIRPCLPLPCVLAPMLACGLFACTSSQSGRTSPSGTGGAGGVSATGGGGVGSGGVVGAGGATPGGSAGTSAAGTGGASAGGVGGVSATGGTSVAGRSGTGSGGVVVTGGSNPGGSAGTSAAGTGGASTGGAGGVSSTGGTSVAGRGGASSGGVVGTGGSTRGGSGGASAAGTGGVSVGGTGGVSAAGGSGVGGLTGTGGATGNELMHATFESRSVGQYTMAMVSGDFGGTPPWNNGLNEGRATIVSEAGNNFLRVTYPANQFGPAAGGVQFMVPLGRSYENLYFSYRVRFGAGFQFVQGGKLPGLVGGTAPTGCISDNGGFSARGMWRTGGTAVQYLYYPEKVNACGDDFKYSAGGTDFKLVPGTWYTLESHVVMNTAGQHNGVLEAWVDGVQMLSLSNFNYRVAGATFGIDALYFSTFFGGSDASWAPTAAQTVDYDEFVISTGRITH